MRCLRWLSFVVFCFSQVSCTPFLRSYLYRLADPGSSYHSDPSIMPFSFKQDLFPRKSTVADKDFSKFSSAKRFFRDIQINNPFPGTQLRLP
ncbi:unnamed protein product [Caenorhabditis auriculariae]|uniref:Secreted protein n=1 Tax=Caenorhabditis auriculariae TaxID=2777116 RepID=A0A8S1H8J1_9PELO|nr:unnamed protein product [Caenorhabditis auriculariae]